MMLKDFINIVDMCPTCNTKMLHTTTHIIPRPQKLLIIACKCGHYESYAYAGEIDDIEVKSILMYLPNHSVGWMDETKNLTIRETNSSVIFESKYPGKILMDWISNPYKNIISKAMNVLLLK